VADVIARIRRAAPFLSGVTVSGGEERRTQAFLEPFSTVRTDTELGGLTCFVDSNGAADVDVAGSGPEMDGAMIDLKCLDSHVRSMTGRQARWCCGRSSAAAS
jgi:pyruvate-formate lyase-activating enzyme